MQASARLSNQVGVYAPISRRDRSKCPGSHSYGHSAQRDHGLAMSAETRSRRVRRRKFTGTKHLEHLAQLCRTPWTEGGFKSHLGRGPSPAGRLQAFLARLRQVEFLGAPVG